MNLPIFYIKEASVLFVNKALLLDINFSIKMGDKISLVGKNGCGKSTTLRIIEQTKPIDEGTLYHDPKVQIQYLGQDNEITHTSKDTIESWIQKNIISCIPKKLQFLISKIKKTPDSLVATLSGGQKKHLKLLKVLSSPAQLLLLDEPTNHLDIESIQWLEEYLKGYEGAVLCISHDRQFNKNFSNSMLWIHNKHIYKNNKGFEYFDQWQEDIIEQERKKKYELKKTLKKEMEWMHGGVTGRRKRNQLRLDNLTKLKNQIKSAYVQDNKLSLEQTKINTKAKFILEVEKIVCEYNNKEIIKDFSFKIIKGERIGIIGKNGCGKSSLLKILTQQIEPKTGKVIHGQNLEIAYFSQDRNEIDTTKSILHNISESGNLTVNFNDKQIHIAAYLKKFLFDPKIIHNNASMLSGGQINKLLLAKILLKKSNLLILDEPTNDLDVEGIETLTDFLQDYPGTIIVVSHDRDFLENITTRSIVMHNNSIKDIQGGFTDYSFLKQDNVKQDIPINKSIRLKKHTKNTTNKISYKDKYALEQLPKTIDNLEKEIKILTGQIEDQSLFGKNKEKFVQITQEITQKQQILEDSLEKLIEIEEKVNKNYPIHVKN